MQQHLRNSQDRQRHKKLLGLRFLMRGSSSLTRFVVEDISTRQSEAEAMPSESSRKAPGTLRDFKSNASTDEFDDPRIRKG
ncbi:Hypothetical protein NTJ_05660 [Nesidiocoris tenuis]|uniref:Uncharacterized protein n=1 Tax=Nesidiocoris tenuis TaxID=355587 RepID=A0ABN7APP0_9HEMI|nr:Hypothetical protein NTJ_05660 [Nesidiocoris tenuis]